MQRNDQLKVPSEGRVEVSSPDRYRLELRHDGVATFMPSEYPPPGIDVPPRHGIFLAEGELAGTFFSSSANEDAVPVVTPHAVVTAHAETRLSIVVSVSGTRIEVRKGKAELKRNRDGNTVVVGAGHYATVSAESKMTTKPLTPDGTGK